VRAGAVDFQRREVFRVDDSYLFATQADRFAPSALIPSDYESGFQFVVDGRTDTFAHEHQIKGETRQVFIEAL